ncbi:MAG: helix-turn-helix domain-containing protein [Aequorivita sp.]|nr:helix-turn-helix domain-containing protein [Aequorivita sp.]
MTKKKRLKKLRNLLLEMGTGKFFYRLERSGKNDNVEALVSVINMMAEEIEEVHVHQGYANANETIKHIVVMHFMFDAKGKILAVNPQACNLLYYVDEDLIGQPLTLLLDENTSKTWEYYLECQQEDNSGENAMQLTFKTKAGLLIPSACYISVINNNKGHEVEKILTVVKHSKKQVALEDELREPALKIYDSEGLEGEIAVEKPMRKKVRLTQDDIKMIEDARSLMLNDLARDFRPLKEFALQLGTNTFKLKYGFKELYGISVYRYLRNERLRKAKVLVQYGDNPFKSIVQLCGFKSEAHFSRTFKKEFGLTPTELRNKTFLNKD